MSARMTKTMEAPLGKRVHQKKWTYGQTLLGKYKTLCWSMRVKQQER